MLKFFYLALPFFFVASSFSQGALIGDTAQAPHPSAMLELKSSSKGLLISRMTTTQRNAIISPAQGLQIFNITTECFEAYFTSVGWRPYACACVNPPAQPGAITGSTNVCLNQQGVSYSIAPVPGAQSYQWTVPPGATVATGQGTASITVNFGTSSGNVSVSALNGCGASSPMNQNITAANPSGNFTYSPNTPSINVGITFSPTTTGASYQWAFQGGNPATSTSQNPVVTWTNSGNYTVSLTVISGACSTSTTQTLTVSNCVLGGSQTFSPTGNIQFWTVPAGICSITIDAYGGQGGRNNLNNRTGGLGARAMGTFNVVGGTQLRIIVGGQGQPGVSNPFGAGSGGGGSAVSVVGQTVPLIVAGGGGGAGGQQGTFHNGGDGQSTQNGANANPGGTSVGGSNGNGGTGGIGHSHCGAAGGGWYTAGTGTVSDGTNGQALSGTATGGNGGSYGTAGAFGGGGGSNIAGGGGGGYGGGAGGDQLPGWIEYGGGGGGSFNSGTNQTNTSGVRTGAGTITISW